MFMQARDKFNINMKASWLIGDREIDITAANAAGISKTILVGDGKVENKMKTKDKFVLKSIKETVTIIK